jgi:aflatoxin B1 aldehyde reductase
MASSPKSNVKVVFGAMTVGKLVSSERVKQWDISVLTRLPGVEMTRVHTLEDTTAILDAFQRHGHNEVDTARVYGEGSSEEHLGNLHWQDRGIVMTRSFTQQRSVQAYPRRSILTRPRISAQVSWPASKH